MDLSGSLLVKSIYWKRSCKVNVSRYAGNVLKNRYASNDESAGINVDFQMENKDGER